MAKPFQDNIDRYQKMLDDLKAGQFAPEPQGMPDDVMSGIIHTESAGDPDAVGDIGAKAGKSIGLTQIQDTTIKSLFKQGKLPKKWKGKNIKRKDLSTLLKDGEFNKTAANILYEDNRKVQRQSLKNRGLPPLPPQEEEDMLIRMHNQGSGKTMIRDVYKEAPVNPRVDRYFQKVKARIEQQAFDDGGVIHAQDGYVPFSPLTEEELAAEQAEQYSLAPDDNLNFDPIDPAVVDRPSGMVDDAAANVSDPYRDLMSQYEDAQKQYAEDKRNAVIGDFASQALSAFGQYSNRRAAAKAQIASGMRFDAPKINIPTTQLVKGLKQPNLREYLQKVELAQKLKEMREGKKLTVSEKLAREKFDYAKKQDKIKKEPKLVKINVYDEETGQTLTKFVHPDEAKSYLQAPKADKTKRDYTIGGIRYSGETDKMIVSEFSSDPKDPLNIAAGKILREDHGVNVGPNFTLTKPYANFLNARSIDKAKSETLKVSQSKLKLAQKREKRLVAGQKVKIGIMKLDERRKDTAHKLKIAEATKMSPKDVETYSGILKQKAIQKDITALVGMVDEKTGKVKLGELSKAKAILHHWIPSLEADEKFIELQALSLGGLFDYIKAISGAQYSVEELTRFEDVFPNAKDTWSQFKAKNRAWSKRITISVDAFELGLAAGSPNYNRAGLNWNKQKPNVARPPSEKKRKEALIWLAKPENTNHPNYEYIRRKYQ